ncbi:hypothetical protein OK016_01060 [Vibrio chagasii]|nr:hypothetical protein [Vibrio chagasii]
MLDLIKRETGHLHRNRWFWVNQKKKINTGVVMLLQLCSDQRRQSVPPDVSPFWDGLPVIYAIILIILIAHELFNLLD